MGHARDDDRINRWLAIALFAHAALFVATMPFGRRALRVDTRAAIWPRPTEAAVDVQRAPEPEPRRALPDPAPAPAPPQHAVAMHAPAHAPPGPLVNEPVAVGSPSLSAMAQSLVNQASAVVTGPAIPEAPAFATGSSTDATYGIVAGDGQGKSPTMDGRATLGGGRGRAGSKGATGPAGRDKSRTASVMGGFTEECDFPREANDANINQAMVVVVVTVEPDGRPSRVVVQNDPGFGFARAAHQCALYTLEYVTARDAEGRPIRGETPPTRIRFSR